MIKGILQVPVLRAAAAVGLALACAIPLYEWGFVKPREAGDVGVIASGLTSILIGAGLALGVLAALGRLAKSWHVRESRLRELERSEFRFREMAEAASDWFWETDEHHKFTHLSDAFHHVTGADPEEIIGKSRLEIATRPLHPEQMAGYLAAIQAHEPIKAFDYVYMRRDGEERVIRASGRPFFDDDGEFLGYRGIGRDVTDRQMAQEVIRESREQLRNVIENCSAAIALRDRKDKFLVANQEFLRRLDVEAEDVIGKTWGDFLPEEEARHLAALDSEVLESGETLETEWTTAEPDGSEHTYMEARFPLVKFDGTVYGVGLVSSDITRRKRAEQKMAEQAELLETIIENIPIALYWKNRDLKYAGGNTNFLKMRGVSARSELIGKSIHDFTESEEEADEITRMDREVFETGQGLIEFEDVQILPDGSESTHLSSKVPLRNLDGETVGIVGIFSDITERKRVEAEIADQRELFETVIETLPVAVFWKDVNGVYQACNQNFVKMRGLESKDQVVGKTIYDFVLNREEADLASANDRRVAEHGESILNVEERTYCAGGKVLTILSSKVPLRGSSGEIVGILGVFADISDQKTIEESLRESEDLLKSIAGATHDGIVLINEKGCVDFWNDAARRMFGYETEEILGKCAHDLLTPERFRGRAEAGFGQFVKVGSGPFVGRTVAVEALRKDGSEFQAELSVSALQRHGQWHGIAIVRNISDRAVVADDLAED